MHLEVRVQRQRSGRARGSLARPAVNLPAAFGPSALVDRTRVVRRLVASAAHPVTAILAPAGCGKSVALQQYLGALEEPHLRYDARPENSTLLGFVRGFADVVHPVAPDARGTVVDAVAGALSSEVPGVSLALWMAEHLAPFAGAIAIDDFHYTDGDSRCAEFVVALVERTKPRIRWILASRSARHLPLTSWLVYGDAAVPIGEEDLRFTAFEAREAARRSRSRLSDEDVERLFETTAGWATAFTLALRVSEYSGDVASAAATARQLSYEYLAEQVYRALTAEERSLLAVGALLPEFDVDVLEKAGFDRAAVTLEELQRRATFLSAAPAAAGTSPGRHYRCHNLFRDFLEHELELQGEEVRGAVYLRAAHALKASGRIIPALGLFSKVRSSGDTLELLVAHGFELAERAHGDAVQAAIDSLPETIRANHPAIVGLRAQFERAAGRFDQAQALYERAIAASQSRDLTAMLVAKLAGALFNAGKSPVAMLEPLAFDLALPTALRCELLSLLGVSYARFGKYGGLDALLNQIEALAWEIDSDVTRAQVLHQLGTAAMLQGDSPRATRILTRAVAIATENGMFKLASLIYTSIGSNAVANDGDLATSLTAARNAGETAVKSGQLFLSGYALARQVDIEVHRGDAARLHELLRSREDLPGPEHAGLAMATSWANAMMAAWEGRFDDASRHQLDVCRRESFEEEQLLMHACCSLFMIASGQREEALAYVRESVRESKGRSPRRLSFDRNREIARALCAITEALAGRSTAAMRLLQKKAAAVTPVTSALLGAAATIVRNLGSGAGNDGLAAYFEVLEAQWFGGYVKMLQAALASHQAEHASTVRLTPAELSVFRALADGRTPKEIALATGCSIHTVRWHIRQTVAKFGCSGREQALRAAFARGLL
jgi:ATP/maltotriose-dependent transcriptional regulator MalT